MKKIFSTIAIVCFSFCQTLEVNAQSPTGEEIKTQFIKDWERAKAYTIEYLNTMPANKYSFKAHDSIRSFAQQMLHLSQANVGLLMGAIGEPLSFASYCFIIREIEVSFLCEKKPVFIISCD